jgi:hypothetical protein
MQRRWVVYLVIGTLFGVFDFVYLGFLSPWQQSFANSPNGQIIRLSIFFVLNLGIWLVPVVPIAVHESRVSRSRLRSAAAGLVVWCAAIVAYYLANAAQLAFWGLPTRMELHVSNYRNEWFWHNWANVLRGDILGGIVEWMAVAIVGGVAVGSLTASAYLRFNHRPQST